MIKRLRHRLKLFWLKRKWVIQCVYNTPEFKKAKDFMDLEKEVTKKYHRALRGEEKLEIAKAEGRMEAISWIKEVKNAK